MSLPPENVPEWKTAESTSQWVHDLRVESDRTRMKYLSSTPDIMGGGLVIKGTRIPIEVILYRLKDGYSVKKIHELYPWIDLRTLKEAIEEALEEAIAAITAL